MRATDVRYAEWMLRIGNGTKPTTPEGEIEIPQQRIYSREETYFFQFQRRKDLSKYMLRFAFSGLEPEHE